METHKKSRPNDELGKLQSCCVWKNNFTPFPAIISDVITRKEETPFWMVIPL